MSVEDVAREVNAAVRKLPAGALEQAGQALQEAHDLLGRAVHGTGDQDAGRAIGLLEEALDDLGRVKQTLTIVERGLHDYLKTLGIVETPASSSNRPAPVAQVQSAKPDKLDFNRVEELRAELPPPVPKPNPESKKTHGRWLDAEGNAQPVASGEDQHSAAAAEMFKRAGVPANKKLSIVTHAEVKVVAQMVQAGQQHSEVIVNNRPCPGPLGCDALLPVLLPAGSSLTVHGPNYRKTYTGGKKW